MDFVITCSLWWKLGVLPMDTWSTSCRPEADRLGVFIGILTPTLLYRRWKSSCYGFWSDLVDGFVARTGKRFGFRKKLTMNMLWVSVMCFSSRVVVWKRSCSLWLIYLLLRFESCRWKISVRLKFEVGRGDRKVDVLKFGDGLVLL